MPRVHPGNPNFQVPDHDPFFDHEQRAWYAATPHGDGRGHGVGFGRVRGGGRGRGGGGGRLDHLKLCYACGKPGHFNRDCPNSRRGNQASGNDHTSNSDAVESTSWVSKVMNTVTEVAKNSEPVKYFFDKSSSNTIDTSPLLAKINDLEHELKLRDEENGGLNIRLKKAETELSSVQAKNDEMILNMDKLRGDLKKCRNELSYEREKETETSGMYMVMKNKFEDIRGNLEKCRNELSSVRQKETESSRMYLVMKKKFEELRGDLEKCRNELSSVTKKETETLRMYLVMKNKFEELKKAHKSADMQGETEQWRKAAKAVASVLDGGEVISSKTAELESLVLYYSNRASKRMSLRKMRKALDDCRIAARLDPSFLKVCLTAGNCHLELGELDDALYNYKKCLESGVFCLDRRFTIEASVGVHKVEKVGSYIKQAVELLRQKTSESATNALEIVMKALSISCFSENLLKMRAEGLFLLQKYDEVVRLCEETFSSAENNCANNQVSNEGQKRQLKSWRWCMMVRSYFRIGSFDMALVTLEKYEQLAPDETKTEDSSSVSVATVSELLRCKSAGNEALKAGRHKEAVKHYSNALQVSIESRSFAAICLCNRAAAHQALGEVVEAIADCNLAIALDETYLKAIFRRANLHEKIRDYEHATLDLQRLITLLETKNEEKHEDLTVARARLSSMNKRSRKGLTLDLYLILGLKGSESGVEIKKAYRKAALRHHPDKVGKFLTRCESDGDGDVWKETFETIHKDADKLYKIIKEAYDVLSDANKRSKYNLEDPLKDDFS